LEKLEGVTTAEEAFARGFEYGRVEDELFGTTDHATLHAIFSLVSFHDLHTGVAMHQAYNRYAWSQALQPCTRKKKKPVKEVIVYKPRPKPRPKKKQPDKSMQVSYNRTLNPHELGSDFQFRSTPDGVRVFGRELISDLLMSQPFRSGLFHINPSRRVGLFPRLGGLADTFQRYRFRKFRLHYVSTCPTTKEGMLGLGFSQDFSDTSPANMPNLLAYENAVGGAVITPSMSTKIYEYRGNEWFNVQPDSEVDPAKIFQMTGFWLVHGANSDDNGNAAGYVMAEYEVEFSGVRGSDQTSTMNTSAADYVINAAGPSFKNDVALQQDASFSTGGFSNSFGIASTRAEAIALEAGRWIWDTYTNWSSVATEDDFKLDEPATMCLPRLVCKHDTVADALKCPIKHQSPVPLAAGDITTQLIVRTPDDDGYTDVPIYTTVASVGTGATSAQNAHDFALTTGSIMIYNMTPTGAEARTVDVSKSRSGFTRVPDGFTFT
jgi:hypothetical protein